MAPSSFEDQMLGLMPTLRRYARSLSQSPDEAEDLLQDCLERGFARRQSWRGDNLKAWMMTIMTNCHRNRHRASSKTPPHVELDAAASHLTAPVGDAHEQERLKAALRALPAEQRAVLMLAALEGYSYEEIAAILSIPKGTVMSRLSRARAGLSAILASDNIISFRRQS